MEISGLGPAAENALDEPPEEFAFIWELFQGLSAARPAGMGPGAIPWGEIQAWAVLHRIRLSHFELMAIRRLDMLWLRVMGEALEKLRNAK